MKNFKLSDSPFAEDANSPNVSVATGQGPYANTRKALESVDLALAQGKKVLLKPNVGRLADPESAIVTHPQVVAAAIDAFTEAGGSVAVGESPIIGVKTLEAFAACGIADVAEQRNCPLLDMDIHPCVDVRVPDGLAIDSLKLCPEILEYDLIVSMPVMKMHMHTGVTLAVKNMKGCLWRRSKVAFHMLDPVEGIDEKSIDVAISDLSSVMRPHLSIIDGTFAMEGMGPSAGSPVHLDVVVVGADAFAADAVACRIMGTDAENIPHLRMGAERGFGVIDMKKIRVNPETWTNAIRPIAGPPVNISMEFDNIRVHDRNSCSACQSTLMLFLKEYGQKIFDYLPGDDESHIAIGKGHDDLPEGTFCIGNCTAALKEKGIFVPGCPPVGSQMLKKLTGKEEVDTADGDRRQA